MSLPSQDESPGTSAATGVPALGSATTPWVTGSVLGAATTALLEGVLTDLAVPAVGSDSMGFAYVFAFLFAQYALVALPLVVVGLVVDRLGLRRDFPEPAALVTVLLVLLAGSAAVLWVDRTLYEYTQEFPHHMKVIAWGGAVGAAAVVGALGWLAVHPALLRFFAQAPVLSSPRIVFASVIAMAGLAMGAVGALGLAPVHLTAPAGLAGAGVAACFVVAFRLGLVTVGEALVRPSLVFGALVFVVGSTVAIRNPHARYSVFAHAPFAGPLASALRDLADLDGDGSVSTWLGGADCAELDASRGPVQRERPGDGVDQDCRGGDASASAPPPAVARPWSDCTPPADLSILLITIDAMRADALSAEITPNIAGLAARSARFTRAYSPATLTRATMASVFGAKPLSDLGTENLVADQSLDFGRPLAQRLADAGYRTAAFNYLKFPQKGYLGFSIVNPMPVMDAKTRGFKYQFNAARMTNGLLSLLAQWGRTRFFVWAHYPDPHAPYYDTFDKRLPVDRFSAYEREVGYVDVHLGRLFAGMRSLGVLERTIVVVTSDHGEDLGRRGRAGHGPDVFEDTIHVPLVMHVPGCKPRSINEPVSLSQLGPTLGALARVEIPGHSLFAKRSLPTVSEAAMTKTDVVRRAVVGDRYKLVVDVRNGGAMLFDLESDPGEDRDVYARQPEAAREAEERYQAWLDAPGRR